jgi:hypothetical protein
MLEHPSFQACLLNHGCRPPPPPDAPAAAAPPVASCRGTPWHLRQRPHPYAVRASVGGREGGGGIALAQGAWENLWHGRRGRRGPQSMREGRGILPHALPPLLRRRVDAGARTGGDHPFNHVSPGSVARRLKIGLGCHARRRSARRTRVRRFGRRGRR